MERERKKEFEVLQILVLRNYLWGKYIFTDFREILEVFIKVILIVFYFENIEFFCLVKVNFWKTRNCI